MKHFLLLILASIAAPLFASEAATNAGVSPFASVRPVRLDEVRWTDGFFFDRFELCRTQMIPSMARLMTGTNYTQFLRNFEIIAGLKDGKVRGASFNDGDFYKFLEGASATLAVTNDLALQKTLDDIIALIAQAQRTNGYVDTWVQWHQSETNSKVAPFSDRNNWEVYNMGQLLTAASVHYRVTGKTNFLNIARKAADCLDQVFEKPTPELALHNICASHYMGIMDLYRVTREPRYLELGKKFLAMRDLVKDGGTDNQDRIPFTKQIDAEGHAVRANYLYAGAADLFLETGDTNLWKPLAQIWTNVVTEKMYLTGGCGALYDGAGPDGGKEQNKISRTHQAYGRDFQLPNTTAHNETCANIGNALWNWRMFLATGEAKFMDVVELELYNSVLSGVSLDGTNFFYTNPLRVTDPLPVELRWSRMRVPFVSSFCCPPNLVRTIAESAGYAYAKSDDAIWVNFYGGSSLATELAGEKIKLSQATEYPWNGRVRIKIEACGKNEFALKLRIPGWASGASVRINNQPAISPATSASSPSPLRGERVGVRGSGVAGQSNAISTSNERSDPSPSIPLPSEGRGRSDAGATESALVVESYFELKRAWKAGDFVDLDLPMPVRKMEANPLVEEDLNQVAIQRGPVVYCLESPDLPKGVKISDVRIPNDVGLHARFDGRLLGGVVVLDGKVLTRVGENWSGKLYREVQPEKFQTNVVKFIPYSVWQNRGPSEMSVWLPRGIEREQTEETIPFPPFAP